MILKRARQRRVGTAVDCAVGVASEASSDNQGGNRTIARLNDRGNVSPPRACPLATGCVDFRPADTIEAPQVGMVALFMRGSGPAIEEKVRFARLPVVARRDVVRPCAQAGGHVHPLPPAVLLSKLERPTVAERSRCTHATKEDETRAGGAPREHVQSVGGPRGR